MDNTYVFWWDCRVLHPTLAGFVLVQDLTVDNLRTLCLRMTKKFMIEPTSMHFLQDGRTIDDQWMEDNKDVFSMTTIPESPLVLVIHNLERQHQTFERYREWAMLDKWRLTQGAVVELGMYIEKRHKCGLDFQPVDLSLFSEDLQTEENKRLVALQWKLLTDGDDEVFAWRHETVGEEGQLNRRFPILRDPTLLNVSTTANVLSLIHGECQIGKGLDIKILNWVLPRLGYFVTFMSRRKNGESTINESRQFFREMKDLGVQLFKLTYNDDPSATVLSFMNTTVLDHNLKNEKRCYTLPDQAGQWKEALIIAGYQTYAFVYSLPMALATVMSSTYCKRAVIADEDDEAIGSYDANGSQVEQNSKLTTMLEILEKQQGASDVNYKQKLMNMKMAYEDVALNDVESWDNIKEDLAAKGFDKSIRASAHINIIITSTGISCLHNSYNSDVQLNVIVKPIPINYHGYGIGQPIEWRKVDELETTALVTAETKTLFDDLRYSKSHRQDKQKFLEKSIEFIKTMPTNARERRDTRKLKGDIINYIEQELHNQETQVERNRRTRKFTQQLDRLRLKYKSVLDPFESHSHQLSTIMTEASSDYLREDMPHVNVLLASGKFTRMETMDHVCKKIVETYGENAPIIGFVYNSHQSCKIMFSVAYNSPYGRHIAIHDLIRSLETTFNDYISVGKTKFTIIDYVVTIEAKVSNTRYRSTHLYYDMVEHIRTCFGIPKPFFVCVSGGMAERQAIFKDGRHRYFLTHMLTSFNSKDMTLMIQKAGRICGLDARDDVERKLYCDTLTWSNLNKAHTLYRRFMDFLSLHRGRTIVEILNAADESMLPVFKEMKLDGHFHRARYAKQMNARVPTLLSQEYLEQVEQFQQIDFTPPAYLKRNTVSDFDSFIRDVKSTHLVALLYVLHDLGDDKYYHSDELYGVLENQGLLDIENFDAPRRAPKSVRHFYSQCQMESKDDQKALILDRIRSVLYNNQGNKGYRCLERVRSNDEGSFMYRLVVPRKTPKS